MFQFKKMTQEEFDALAVKDRHTFYMIIQNEEEPIIESISIWEPPNKQKYLLGDPLDFSEIQMQFNYTHPTSTGVIGDHVTYEYFHDLFDTSVEEGTPVTSEIIERPIIIWYPKSGLVTPYEPHQFTALLWLSYAD